MNGEWNRNITRIIEKIDECIREGSDEALTLRRLAVQLGYSEYHFSRMFRQVSGMRLREYLRYRRLAFALAPVPDTRDSFLKIALDYGFSSHEAFTRAFKQAYGLTPREYRQNPAPVALHTILRPFDCYLLEKGRAEGAEGTIRTYFVTVPAHKFLHIRNCRSIGYWDFWQRQNKIPGQNQETVCGLLADIPGRLDDRGGQEMDGSSGQIMAFLNDPAGRICSWGIPLAECWGVRLPLGYTGRVPPGMQLLEVPEGEYIVFEHGPFDPEKENALVEERMETAMREFDYKASGYRLDTSPGRIFYFYHDPQRYWKYIRPVKREGPGD